MANESSLTLYFTFLLLTATLGPLLFGYHLAELNAPSDIIRCIKQELDSGPRTMPSAYSDGVHFHTILTGELIPRCIPMNPTEFGLVSSSFTLGGLIGALAAGPLTATKGRIRGMLYSALCATIGPGFEATAPSIAFMSLGRFVSGLGSGCAMVVVPIYIFEIAPPGRKGFFGSFTQVMVNMGILITQVLGYYFSTDHYQLWRVILGAGGVIGLVQLFFLLLAGQESPKYLAEHGNYAEARRVLQKIRGRNVDIDAEVAAWDEGQRNVVTEEQGLLANEETASLEHTEESHTAQFPSKLNKKLLLPKGETLGTLAVLRNPTTRPAVLAIMMVMLAQQFTGINSIIMYGVALLSDLLTANSILLNIFVSVLNVIVTASAAPLVEKLGRKTCLLISIVGMGITSLLLAFGIMNSIAILSAVAVIIFVASFGLGLGPIPFILPSEFVDASAVGATQSWALATNWIATFIVAQFFPVLNEKLGKGQVYFIFAGAALLFALLVMRFVPESKGRKDPDEVWGRKRDRVDARID